jgi:hypothetical protein
MIDAKMICQRQHSTRTARPPAFRQEPQRRYPVRNAGYFLRLIVPLLGGMLVLAGCQNQSFSGNGERRDGFYGGISGGFSRP